jgi:hypothetical protein
MRQLTEAEAWLEIIEETAERIERHSHGFLCPQVITLATSGRISPETSDAMYARIKLFQTGDRYAYWHPEHGDELTERLLAACFCLAMCEAGEAA